ncbi:MAG: hypothetical protein ABI747_02865 [Candidatus Moraniibacteriota bacterium]
MYKRKIILGCILVTIIVFGVFFLFIWRKDRVINQNLGTQEALTQKSEHFRIGYSFYQSRKMDEALTEFRLAEKDTTNKQERGLVDLLIGISMDRSGDHLNAVAYLKSMGENPEFTNEARAYAIQYLGRMYFVSYDTTLLDAIYSTDPYKKFYAEKDPLLATRRLYEYASSYQPLAFSEIRIAALSLNEALKSCGAPTETSLLHVKDHIIKADQDIKKLGQEGPASRNRLPEIYAHKAFVMTDLYALNDRSLGDPEPVFRLALAADAQHNSHPDGIILYNYALFLARSSPLERKNAIVNLLANYKDDFYRNSVAERSFVSARTNPSFEKTRRGLILLSQTDPQFKEYLTQLGWTETDFQENDTDKKCTPK